MSRPYPAAAFEDSLLLAEAFHQLGERRVRRLTLFDHLKKAPESGPSRQLISNSSRYGLTSGSYKAEYLELTDDGYAATASEVTPQDRLRARFKLAIGSIPLFSAVFERFKGNKIPAAVVLRDFLVDEMELAADDVERAVEIFTLNAKCAGVLKPISGAERLVSIEHAADDLAKSRQESQTTRVPSTPTTVTAHAPRVVSGTSKSLDQVCFYVSPIGEPASLFRQHADLFQGALIEPAMEKLGLEVVRADAIAQSGMITSQVLLHLRRARLVVADLSFLNANVFYEMALRHACRLPIVQVIRKEDHLPFDVNQVRTVVIDTSSIYTLVPQINTYIAEIANHSRAALEDPNNVSNPVSVFFPEYWASDESGA